MKGFKATYNYKCKDVEFSVGQTYTVDELKMCESGFHFCSNIPDTFSYYPPNKDIILLEVEALGTVITEDDKHVTDKIKILREIPKEELEEWLKFDSNDNQIYSKDSSGIEYWYKYNSNNNLIYYKNSRGFEFWQEYDSNNNLIHSKDSNGIEKSY